MAIAGSRRLRDVSAVVLAGGGIALLARGGGRLDATGLLFAALAGACWATYIVVSAAVGRRSTGGAPLAVAMTVAVLLALPFGAGRAVHADGASLLSGAAVGLLSTVVPYTFELEALRRLPARVFGVLMSMEPAPGPAAAAAGAVRPVPPG